MINHDKCPSIRSEREEMQRDLKSLQEKFSDLVSEGLPVDEIQKELDALSLREEQFSLKCSLQREVFLELAKEASSHPAFSIQTVTRIMDGDSGIILSSMLLEPPSSLVPKKKVFEFFRALEKFDETSLDNLMEVVEQDHGGLRKDVLYFLSAYHRCPDYVVPKLIGLLKSDFQRLKIDAAEALAGYGQKAKDRGAVQELHEVIDSHVIGSGEGLALRKAASDALDKISEGDFILQLKNKIRDDNRFIVHGIKQAWGSIKGIFSGGS